MSYSEKIRNFCIIAHIDHGKTTLTDRLLLATDAIDERQFHEQLMDSNPIEQERGITIKLAPVRMNWRGFVLNLIDTPGHVDFGYEVSRSLAACEGALLVVDATQGVQAQTLSTYQTAKQMGLVIVPVINKIDLPSADVEKTTLELMELCDISEDEVIKISAKSGENIEAVLQSVIDRIPAPQGKDNRPLKALLITSLFDTHKGAIGLVRVVDGQINSKEKLQFMFDKHGFVPVEIGVYQPAMKPTKNLRAGEVGYVATGLKDVRGLKIGDTLTSAGQEIESLPGFKEPQPLVFMDIFPIDQAEFPTLQDAMSKLALRDAALDYSGTFSQALGSGLRVGFLGILHAEIVLERLQREFDLQLVATAPSVVYQVDTKSGKRIYVNSPIDMPDPSEVELIQEPMASLKIYTPEQYIGQLLKLCRERRGVVESSQPFSDLMMLTCSIPLAELITDFHDTVKSISSGFASIEYKVAGYQPVDAVTVTILLNHEPVPALSFIAVQDQAELKGRKMVAKLKEAIPRQMFAIPIQAAIGGKIIARETLQAYRKDVTAKLYGGDVTRRKKLLAKQAKGKKWRKQFGKVELDQDTFINLLKQS